MYNNFTGVGNLARDPEARQAGETSIATFTVCCDSGFGDKKHTEFVRCVCFGKLAEVVISYLRKGSKVLILGEMRTRKWTDKDGRDIYTTEIIAREMKMLGGKSDTHDTHEPDPMAGTGEDVPF